jgi:hypothetical protein
MWIPLIACWLKFLTQLALNVVNYSQSIDELITVAENIHLTDYEAEAEAEDTPVASHTDHEMISMYEEEIEKLSDNRDRQSKFIDELQKQNESLRVENSRLITSANRTVGAGLSEAMKKVLFGRPCSATCFDAAIAVQESYMHVDFADGCLDEMKSVDFIRVSRLFESLVLLADEYYSSIMAGNPDAVAKECFSDIYRANESDTVENMPKLRAQREFTYQGNTILMRQHLTLGAARSPKTTCQVHFAIVDGKLIIGRIGHHLPVASS